MTTTTIKIKDMSVPRTLLLILMPLLLTSCAKLQHLDQLLTLKGLSD
jgi:hypothetical protein